MAAKYGVNYTRFLAKGKYEVGEYDGRVRMLKDSYVFPADAFSASDTIQIGILRKGAKVVDAGIRIPVSLGTTGIFDLGTTDDPNGFVSGADAGGQAAVKKASTEALIGAKFDADTAVLLDCTEATDAAEGDSIEAWVEYVMD